MPKLFGKMWSRNELRRYCGTLRQVAGCSRYTLQEGYESGVDVCEVRTGSGLRFGVSPTRGLDILFAEHNGRSLCWQSAAGWQHPSYFEDHNLGWLRGFGGGLLTTCGLSSIGPACEDGGEQFGLHDRIAFIPATGVKVEEIWSDDGASCEFAVEGTLRQTRVFGPNLVLRRRVSAHLGADHLVVRDWLTNEGFEAAPAVILYHCNFGFPVVSEHSTIVAASERCEPRDASAALGVDTWNRLEAPQAGYSERCYFHTMKPESDGSVKVEIWNEELNFGGFIRYRAAELPHFTQWKMMGGGAYVCGLEPSNARLASRTELRASDELPILEPGQTVAFEVELGAVTRSE